MSTIVTLPTFFNCIEPGQVWVWRIRSIAYGYETLIDRIDADSWDEHQKPVIWGWDQWRFGRLERYSVQYFLSCYEPTDPKILGKFDEAFLLGGLS